MTCSYMDVDARYKQGQTILMRASARGVTRTIRKLLALGADVFAKDKNGKGAFDHAKEIKDQEKKAALLALMSEYSPLRGCDVQGGPGVCSCLQGLQRERNRCGGELVPPPEK